MAERSPNRQGYEQFGSQVIPPSPLSSFKRLFSRQQVEVNRVVYVDNHLLPGGDEQLALPEFPDNTVVSSKYTLLTFLPKNLFEQFRRIANFYFLCVALIQFIIDTPVTPLTSILPLAFVISVTAIKQGYEDWLRHKADNEVNQRPTRIIRNGVCLTDVRSMDIKVGDIVQVFINEEFPCDLVMLSSPDPQGQCFVTTANLDGETNLKNHFCLSESRKFNTAEMLGHLRARITCKPPIPDLYTFEGVMEFVGDTEGKPLGPEHLLLRGARLKNTEYIFGCAVYTGRDTKMALNSKAKKTKFSQVERKMNTFLIVFLILLLVESVVSTGLKYWFEEENGVPWYIPEESEPSEVSKKALKAVEYTLAFMVLYNYIIPISLYVTVEMQKFFGSMFFGLDCEMYDETINARAQANTSDLNEELGQVEYLFTDKTGTLTENTMVFRRCCISSRLFEDMDGALCERTGMDINLTPINEFTKEMDDFIRVLVLCHTVRVDHHHTGGVNGASSVYSNTGEHYIYQASSPDEKALVEACVKYGIVYHGIHDDALEASFHGTMMRFQLLHTLPFDPTRKRMSVIIRTEEGECILLCKGAEVAILDRVVDGDVDITQQLIDGYAKLGLRTLTIAQRHLSEGEYLEIDTKLSEAKRSLVKREENLSLVYNEVETKLTLLGATAVEDKLQDQVPQTIEALRMAGIKVWVLTGDKEETAVNISHSAGHFNSDMTFLYLTQVASDEQCEQQLCHLLDITAVASSSIQHAFVIDGQSLAYALTKHQDSLCKLCRRCTAVLCCRMSPIQKAEVVAMIKTSPGNPVTAAIGDGANDVSMIQEAHVGLGIMGKEGRQAVRNSDYAFGKFRFLRRALLFHGHLYYNRIAILVQYFFYKNIAWITCQLFYAIFNSWSQQSLFDPFYLVFYNLCFTSLPILIYGIFEQHKTQDDLLNNPKLYRKISRNAILSWPQFLKWNFLGLWHCCVIFFGYFLVNWKGVSLFKNGETIGNFDVGTLIVYTCVTTVNIKLMLETYYWCLPTFIAYGITLIGLIVLSAVYANIFWPSFVVTSNDMFGALNQIYDTPTTWLAMLLFIVLALIPDIILRAIRDISQVRLRKSYGRKRSSLTGLANGCGQVKSTSYSQWPQEVDTVFMTSADTIELQHNTSASYQSTLQGYVNPALSLSSENIATSVVKPRIPSKHAESPTVPIPPQNETRYMNTNISDFTSHFPTVSTSINVVRGGSTEHTPTLANRIPHSTADTPLVNNVGSVDDPEPVLAAQQLSNDFFDSKLEVLPTTQFNNYVNGSVEMQSESQVPFMSLGINSPENNLTPNRHEESSEDKNVSFLQASLPAHSHHSEVAGKNSDMDPQVSKEAEFSSFTSSPSHVVTINVKHRHAKNDEVSGSLNTSDVIIESAHL